MRTAPSVCGRSPWKKAKTPQPAIIPHPKPNQTKPNQTKPHRAALRTGIGCGQLAPQVLTARRMTCSARALWPGACAVPSVPQRRSCAKPIFCQPAQRLSSALLICPTPPCRRCAWRMAHGAWRMAGSGAPLSIRLPARRTTPNDPAVAAVVGGFGLAQRLSLDGRTLA